MKAAIELPPGFRFHPTDEELVMHYLCRKCASQSIAVPIIAELDLYKYDPWELPGMALCGEKEWYFFSPRERKYPNGSRPNRAAGTGYWKATGADKPIGQPKPLGIKKALVFYSGKAPKGDKTNWIMHEYRLADVDRSARKKNSLRLDDWVLCRIYNRKGTSEKRVPHQLGVLKAEPMVEEEKKPVVMAPVPPAPLSVGNDYVYFENSDLVPRLHTDSSTSEHVVSPEFNCEVQSEPKWKDLGNHSGNALDYPYNHMDATMGNSLLQGNNQEWPLQDMFMFLQKPFGVNL